MNYPKNRYSGESPWTNKEWLYHQYVIKNKSSQEIADEHGCKQNTIQQWLLKHNIKKKITTRKRKQKHQYESYDYLYEHHVTLGIPIQEIADMNDVSYDTISHHMKKNDIKIVKKNPHKKYNEEDIDEMVRLYSDSMMSANQIAKKFKTSHKVVISYLQQRGISTRGLSEAQFARLGKDVPFELEDSEFLNSLHWDENKTCKEIGELLGVDAGTVRRQMQRLGLKTKDNATSKIGLMVGDKHPNWQGGLSTLKELLRGYFHTNQAPKVAKRDNYQCQRCGATHIALHVHHINEFSKIVEEICLEHAELNPDNVDDRIKLYNIVINDDRFIDENNLITYCRDCHLFKIHNYKRSKTISSQASVEEGSETIPEGSTS